MINSQTHKEIFQQPDTWLDTLERARYCHFRSELEQGSVFFTGAGSSAYAGAAIEAAWPCARAIPSTDLLTGGDFFIHDKGALLSLARSGDSPETVAVIDRVQRLRPDVRHFAITCNGSSALAQRLEGSTLVLDPRTNDRSLAMTSSFSNLVLAGLCLRNLDALLPVVAPIAEAVRTSLPEIEETARSIAQADPARVVLLASWPLAAIAREGALKILEMTAGRVVAFSETFLGLRHGPMSFLRPDTLVLAWLSSDPVRRSYEEDLLAELRAKKIGRIVRIGANAPDLADQFRGPFEIVFAQLLAYHLSLRAGLDPDNPSPDGVITRVVHGVRLHA